MAKQAAAFFADQVSREFVVDLFTYGETCWAIHFASDNWTHVLPPMASLDLLRFNVFCVSVARLSGNISFPHS